MTSNSRNRLTFATSGDNAKLFKQLDEQLKLELPKGQVEIAKDYLKDTLEKLSAFEPEEFRRTFEQLQPASRGP